MRQRVGDGHVGERLRRAAAEGPARGGDHEAGDGALGGARQALGERGVLAVDREHPPPAGAQPVHHERAARDQALLVRERQVGARGERRQRGAQARGADDRVQDDVCAALPDQPFDAGGALDHLAVELTAGGRGGGRVDERDPPHPVAAGGGDQAGVIRVGRERARGELGVRAHDLERLRADRSGRAQDGH